MKTYTLNSEITLTENQMKDIAEAYNKPEFEYPIFKRSKYIGIIVKFTDIKDGVVVWAGTTTYSIGSLYEDWNEHTNKSAWEDVAYDKELDLWDKQPVLCWNNRAVFICTRAIGFYDAINKCIFCISGKPNGLKYDNYEAIPPEHYDEWMIEAYKTLEEEQDEI